MVETAGRASGLRTARYTSPHLVRIEERFVVDGRPVTEGALRDAAAEVQAAVSGLRVRGTLDTEPTFFEVTTAIAFELFRRAGVQVAVLEVGMGGRFDATNIVTPLAAAITTIDIDHERLLGNTIAQIAFEKAGVIKPGIPDVIASACEQRGARLVPAWEGVDADVALRDGRTVVELKTRQRSYGTVPLALRGRHQAQNAIVAVRLLEELDARGVAVPGAAILEGLTATAWRGRLDLLDAGGGRRLLLDAAHNPAGARVLGDYLREVYPDGLPLVFAAMRDKDAGGMFEVLLPAVTRLVVTAPRIARAASPDTLAAKARAVRPTLAIDVEPDTDAALERAWAGSTQVAAAGSIFLAGEILAAHASFRPVS
jgi:dihydrofolate synthase/folylpolyglutamate synthase